MKNIVKYIYVAGVIVSKLPSWLVAVKKDYDKVYAHHMTVKFGDIGEEELSLLGRKIKFCAESFAADEKAFALKGSLSSEDEDIAELMKNNGQLAHVTMFTSEGTPPVYSNELLRRAEEEGLIEALPLKFDIEMEVGAFAAYDDGTTGWIFSRDNN